MCLRRRRRLGCLDDHCLLNTRRRVISNVGNTTVERLVEGNVCANIEAVAQDFGLGKVAIECGVVVT